MFSDTICTLYEEKWLLKACNSKGQCSPKSKMDILPLQCLLPETMTCLLKMTHRPGVSNSIHVGTIFCLPTAHNKVCDE